MAPSRGLEGCTPCTPSIWQITKELKREENSTYSCLLSIIDDASFVREIQLLYAGESNVPLLANLRCGLWYTSNAHVSGGYLW